MEFRKMDIEWKTGQEDIEFLMDLATKPLSVVAEKWITRKGWDTILAEGNARQWLGRIRKRILRNQAYLNKIRGLQKKYPRIRKLTTSGTPETEEEDGLIIG
jgi:hypothetical protein